MTDLEVNDALLKGLNAIDRNQKQFKDDIERLATSQEELASRLNAIQRFQLNERASARSNAANTIAGIPEEIRRGFSAKVRQMLRATRFSAQDAKAYDDLVHRAIGEDSSPGSTLITDGILREVYDVLGTYGKFNTLAVRRMGTKLTKLPISTARPKAQFILSEAGTISDDTTKAGTSVDLEAEVIAVLLNVSMQLLEDADFDISALVLSDFMEAYAERLDYAAFSADGTSDGDNGGFTGLFNFGTAADAASGNTTVETLDLDDFIRCLNTVAPIVLSRRSRWWMHPQILARAMSVKDGNGRPIFQNSLEAPAYGAIGSLLGYPVELVHAAPSANTAGSPVAVFGDPDGFVVGIRSDFRFEHTDAARWTTFQRSFRGVGRAGVEGRRSTAFAVLTLAAS